MKARVSTSRNADEPPARESRRSRDWRGVLSMRTLADIARLQRERPGCDLALRYGPVRAYGWACPIPPCKASR